MKMTPPGIAIVATGGYAPDSDAMLRAVDGLREHGHLVRNYYQAEQRYQRFGGTDDARLAQLHDAARDPEIDIVIALRGGYGSSRLLESIDFDLLASSGKLFVGHSDFTALQLGLLARTGASSFSGPMICDDFTRADRSQFTMAQFWDCIARPQHQLDWECKNSPDLAVEGTLWGGNLTMLATLVGTPYLPRIAGGILFLEEVNEHPYRIERMLLQLLHAGVLEQQQALVLGDLGTVRLTDYENGYGFESMLAWSRQHLPLPVVTGLPVGHIRDKATLAVGADATLTVSDGKASLAMHNYLSLASLALADAAAK
ncbi:muramoyltetrapeptide carboxypeptidase [Lacisediminimonas sp.]|uniref:muramoyltetrapeptide carboxypeptidase n=1 Tax=Lacisediminimonas sp. TaxID=3060582 RepID=UPI002715BAFF|nr:muramoyltetrapeptide carboxypeptidase [Lacisediminimonas sp.]MDO8298187.1 muramoyltetrapeptide carboxypeptidase [Lacisediminimonas sp.]